MQVQAIVPNGDSRVTVQSFPEIESRTTKKIVQIGDRRHLYITNINGSNSDGSFSTDFREQSDLMFAKCVPMLEEHGANFRQACAHVVLSGRD